MPEIEVFMTLEDRAANVVARAADDHIQELVDRLETEAEDPRDAARIVDDLNLGPVAASVRGELEVLALNGVLLGASRWTEGQADRTRFVRDGEMPLEVVSQVEQIIQFMDGPGTEAVREELHEIIQEEMAQDPSSGVVGVSDRVLGQRVGFAKQGGLASRLNAAVKSGTKVQASMGANLMTNRMVLFGALSQAQDLGEGQYQWDAVLDSDTCPFCRSMNGKVFTVGPNLERLDTIILSGDPEVARSLSPWPSQSRDNLARLSTFTDEKLDADGFGLPPAHGFCRCVPSPVGMVPPDQIIGFEGVLSQIGLVGRNTAVSTEEMFRRPNGTWLSGRVRDVHDPAVAKALSNKPPVPQGERPTYRMLGGGSGAGKGTIQQKGLVKVPKRMVTVDSDELKKAIPEYQTMVTAGDTKAAAFAHEESSFLSKRVVRESLDRRMDVFLDGTGDGSIEKLVGKIQPARSAGYRVVADYVTIPTDVAVDRAVKRAIRTGRMVPETAIRKIHRDVSRTFEKAVDRDLFDEVRLWDNSGADPVLVMQQVDGNTTVFRQDLWDDFLSKADEDITRKTITATDMKAIENALKGS